MTTHKQLRDNFDGQLEDVFFNRKMIVDDPPPTTHYEILVGTLNKLTIAGIFQTETNLHYRAATSELRAKIGSLTKRTLCHSQANKNFKTDTKCKSHDAFSDSIDKAI